MTSMKIYAFQVTVIQDGDNKRGLYMAVSHDGFDAQKKVIKEVEAIQNIKKGSINFELKCSMSLDQLARELRPEIDKLVKETSVKNDLLDVIKRLPID